jgi:hypothetical protein
VAGRLVSTQSKRVDSNKQQAQGGGKPNQASDSDCSTFVHTRQQRRRPEQKITVNSQDRAVLTVSGFQSRGDWICGNFLISMHPRKKFTGLPTGLPVYGFLQPPN